MISMTTKVRAMSAVAHHLNTDITSERAKRDQGRGGLKFTWWCCEGAITLSELGSGSLPLTSCSTALLFESASCPDAKPDTHVFPTPTLRGNTMGLAPAPPQPAASCSERNEGHLYIAGYRMKPHALGRSTQANTPNVAIAAAILFGREIKSKHGRGCRVVKVLNKRTIRKSHKKGLNVCWSWLGLGVVINTRKKVVVTVDRELDCSGSSYRKFRG